MADLGTVTFQGQSGRQYEFHIYPPDTTFRAVGAVYLMAHRYPKPDSGHYVTPIYFGETGSLPERFANHHRQACFDRNNVNCVAIHQDADAESRRAKETDLIRRWDPTCNRQ